MRKKRNKTHQYFLIYKPFEHLSQFSQDVPGQLTLKNLDHTFDSDIYPVGRLDKNSEGLLILTSDPSVDKKIMGSENKLVKSYWVQVEGEISEEACKKMELGFMIRIKKKDTFLQAEKTRIAQNEPSLPKRNPPIRKRENIPTSWVKIDLTQGKYHQIRKMCAHVGFPVLRLVRHSIYRFNIDGMLPGDIVEMTDQDFDRALN